MKRAAAILLTAGLFAIFVIPSFHPTLWQVNGLHAREADGIRQGLPSQEHPFTVHACPVFILCPPSDPSMPAVSAGVRASTPEEGTGVRLACIAGRSPPDGTVS